MYPAFAHKKRRGITPRLYALFFFRPPVPYSRNVSGGPRRADSRSYFLSFVSADCMVTVPREIGARLSGELRVLGCLHRLLPEERVENDRFRCASFVVAAPRESGAASHGSFSSSPPSSAPSRSARKSALNKNRRSEFFGPLCRAAPCPGDFLCFHLRLSRITIWVRGGGRAIVFSRSEKSSRNRLNFGRKKTRPPAPLDLLCTLSGRGGRWRGRMTGPKSPGSFLAVRRASGAAPGGVPALPEAEADLGRIRAGEADARGQVDVPRRNGVAGFARLRAAQVDLEPEPSGVEEP